MDSSLLPTLAEKLGIQLKNRHWQLTTVESCTGGGLAYWVTSIPGSSTWFTGGYVTYSDRAKVDMVDVRPATLQSIGAVSEATARELADGSLKKTRADVSIAITGIAGPDGGSQEKPVGTVWFAWASPHFPLHTRLKTFSGNRQEIREQAIAFAFTTLLELLAAI